MCQSNEKAGAAETAKGELEASLGEALEHNRALFERVSADAGRLEELQRYVHGVEAEASATRARHESEVAALVREAAELRDQLSQVILAILLVCMFLSDFTSFGCRRGLSRGSKRFNCLSICGEKWCRMFCILTLQSSSPAQYCVC